MTNAEISDVFSLLSKLMDIHGENSFKTKSYANAAFQIDRLPVQLSEIDRHEIAAQKGIGESTATKVIELLDTGSLQVLQQLLDKTPSGILELMKIKGIGPKKIATIWHELGIESPGELLYACEENRLVNYKGFGEKTQSSIEEAIRYYLSNQGSFLYAQIEPIAWKLLSALQLWFDDETICISGSFLRQLDTIDQLDYIIPYSIGDIKNVLRKQEGFVCSAEDADSVFYTYQQHLQIQLHSCTPESLVQTSFLVSCSSEYRDAFLQQYPDILEAGSEEEIYENQDLPYVPPCLREEQSQVGMMDVPNLIDVKDIRGIIHNHSTWSDGKYSIEEMAKACIEKGFEYLVMSDHSVSSFYANGLSVERIRLQHEEIDRLNERLAPFTIFKSIECDILGDGSLDYRDEVLATFDLVICSVHQNLKMTEEKAMQRLLGAITHPATRILGHPSGRLLLSRKAYPVDYKTLIDACKAHDVVIEINANPRRLDIDWHWISYAMQQGVRLSINPDAHSIEGIDDIRYGVLSAQKGGLTAAANLSSLSLADFKQYLTQKSFAIR